MHARPHATAREYLVTEALGRALGVARATVRRTIRGPNERKPASVRVSYDALRSACGVTDFDDFVFGPASEECHVLVDDRIVWGTGGDVQRQFLPRLSAALDKYVNGLDRPTIVEFGAGRGRNLIYLKRHHPHWNLIGIDISPVSVDLARERAARYNVSIDVRAADVTLPIQSLPKVDICYSVHALEQMPRIFRKAVSNMLATAELAVLFFEPVAELYPKNLRGYIARMYNREHDYLDGLHKYLVAAGATITKAERLRTATNPLNETVEIHVRPAR